MSFHVYSMSIFSLYVVIKVENMHYFTLFRKKTLILHIQLESLTSYFILVDK